MYMSKKSMNMTEINDMYIMKDSISDNGLNDFKDSSSKGWKEKAKPMSYNVPRKKGPNVQKPKFGEKQNIFTKIKNLFRKKKYYNVDKL